MDGATCIFCVAPSSKSGEHVWPLWFLRMFNDEGPFHLEVGGEPHLKKNRTLRTTANLEGLRVPMCQPHNAILNQRFEEPAKPIIRSAKQGVTDARWQNLTAAKVGSMASWVIKVGLLSKHPRATFDNPAMDAQLERWSDFDSELFDWLVTGAPVPSDLTVFASFASSLVDPDPAGTLHVPGIIRADGVTRMSRHVAFGFLDLSFDVLYHPMRRVRHPLVPGRAVEVWPASVTGSDLQALTPSHSRDVRFVVSGSLELMPHSRRDDVPPIAVDTDMNALVKSGVVRSHSI